MSLRRRLLYAGAAAALALGLSGLMACRRSASQSGGPEPRADKLEKRLGGVVSPGEPGIAVLVVKDGKAVFNRGYGVADLRTGRPIDPRTNFRLASVSKAFTAAAVMLLVRDGRLRYDNRLTDLIPDFPEYGRGIMIRHLLQHTSGLPDYEDLMPPSVEAGDSGPAQISDAGVLDLLKRTSDPLFLPGREWKYSNSGYVVLGAIVSAVSGLPYEDFLTGRIFAPLGMSRTLAYVRGRNEIPDRAFGHGRSKGGWKETDQSPTSATLGDGGVYSSLEDLAKWDDALGRGSLISGPDMRPSLEPARVAGAGPSEPDGSPAEYGFGWFLNPWKGRFRMWHYGETRGFRTAIERFTADRLSVVVLSNRSDIDAAGLALEAAAIYLSR